MNKLVPTCLLVLLGGCSASQVQKPAKKDLHSLIVGKWQLSGIGRISMHDRTKSWDQYYDTYKADGTFIEELGTLDGSETSWIKGGWKLLPDNKLMTSIKQTSGKIKKGATVKKIHWHKFSTKNTNTKALLRIDQQYMVLKEITDSQSPLYGLLFECKRLPDNAAL